MFDALFRHRKCKLLSFETGFTAPLRRTERHQITNATVRYSATEGCKFIQKDIFVHFVVLFQVC